MLLFNSSPPVYADRLRTRHAVVRICYDPKQFAGGNLMQSREIATLLNIRGKGAEEIADRLGRLDLPHTTTSVWIENI